MIEIGEPMIGNQTMREYLKAFGFSDCEIEKAIKDYSELPKPVFNIFERVTKNMRGAI